MNKLSHLIEALQILLKYGDISYPTHCEHDVLYVSICPGNVSQDDSARLEELGFNADYDEEAFSSFRFGSN